MDGEVVGNAEITGGSVLRMRTLDPPDLEVQEGGPSTVRFDGLPSGAKRIEVWLPHNAAVEVRALRVDDGRVRDAPRGDASSVGALRELDQPMRRSAAADVGLAGAGRCRVGVDLVDLAFAGEAQLDQFVAATSAISTSTS